MNEETLDTQNPSPAGKASAQPDATRAPVTKKKRAKASFSHCKSPKTYKHLAAGSYTFRVRAFNALGRDPTPAKKSFKL